MIDHTMTKFQNDLFNAGFWDLSDEMRAGVYAAFLGAVRVLVTAKRGKHADEKWKNVSVICHMDHAAEHANIAADHCLNTSLVGSIEAIDDDALPHVDHATARICCAHGYGLLCVEGRDE